MSDLKASVSEGNQNKETKNLPLKFYILLAVCTVALGGICFLVISLFDGAVDQSVYSIGYAVNASPEAGSLDVTVHLDVEKLSRDRVILLYRGAMTELTMTIVQCADSAGNAVPFTETADLVSVGPINDDTARVSLQYYADIAALNVEDGYSGLPLYAGGCLLEDLIAFSGKNALLTPFLDPILFEAMDRYVTSVSFDFTVPEGLKPIIPYQTPIDGALSFTVDKPGWDFFNCISESAFCFGQFERYDYNGNFGDAAIYADQAVIDTLSQYSLDAMTGLLYYYTNVFGEPLGDVPIVLLRNMPDDDLVITAGVGSGGAAMSANMRIADDFRAMSNMMYHAFFDSKIKPYNLRYPSAQWIYDGAAEFYVGNSVDYLLDHVKEQYEIGDASPISDQYLRYLYFALKEPGFLAIGPAAETTGMYIPQEQFYIGVKSPLIIDVINYSINERTGQSDGFIKELVKRGESASPLDIERLIREVCGADAPVITDYLSGKALIPNYRNFNIDGMPKQEIVNMLDQDEQKYGYYFSRHNVYYPYISMSLLNEAPFMAAAAERGIPYNADDIQMTVQSFSGVLHRLLLQRAMWASFAGIDDITLPNIVREITQDSVREEWSAFCEDIGFEYRIGDD